MNKARKVLVLGGYGLIGSTIVHELLEAGHAVTALGRNPATARRGESRCSWRKFDIASARSPTDWMPILDGIDVVVNASGALQSGMSDNVAAVQRDAIVALIEAMPSSLAGLFVQISAPGATETSRTEFMSTKGQTDAFLRASAVPYVILKPGLVISPQAYGGTALLRMLSAFPWVLPLISADRPVATVPVSEVAAAVRMAVEGAIPAGSEMDLVEDKPARLEDVVLDFRRWLGNPEPFAVVKVPSWMGKIAGHGADLLGLLGWRSPMRTTALTAIEDGVTGDPEPYRVVTGRTVPGLEETLRNMPATVQERWFASLYLMMPILLAALSVFWTASGVIGLVEFRQAASVLEPHLGGKFAMAAVTLGSLIDVALGVAILVKPVARKAATAMIAVSIAYLVAGTAVTPALWADPLGPFLKILPAIMAAWTARILIGTR